MTSFFHELTQVFTWLREAILPPSPQVLVSRSGGDATQPTITRGPDIRAVVVHGGLSKHFTCGLDLATLPRLMAMPDLEGGELDPARR